MNAFRRVSDLVADAEDLVGKIGDAASPEIKALHNPRQPKQRIDNSFDHVSGGRINICLIRPIP